MKALRTEVAAKYALIGIRPGKYAFKGFGEIDLSELTVAKADELFKRGFPYLKLKNAKAAPEPVTGSQKVKPIVPLKPAVEPVNPDKIPQLRKNKKFVNSLLMLEFKDLDENTRTVFFDNEDYFQEKKKLLLQVSETDRQMQGIHSKLKALAKDDDSTLQERGELMDELSALEEKKLETFGKIDTWDEPAGKPSDPDKIKEKAAEEAIKKQKLIDAHENYIYRNEPSLANMPESTPGQKKKKAEKAAEIERRKQELIALGKPYQRKSRK